MKREDVYLLNMLLYLRKAQNFNRGVSFDDFLQDEKLQLATIHALQIVGEAAGRVSSEFRLQHPMIPWNRIIGFQHKVVHDYPRIELPKVWAIVNGGLQPTIDILASLVPPPDADEPEGRAEQ